MDNAIFRNPLFKRDYNCTNVVAVEILDATNAAVPKGFVSATPDCLDKLTPLYVQGGVKYWGYL